MYNTNNAVPYMAALLEKYEITSKHKEVFVRTFVCQHKALLEEVARSNADTDAGTTDADSISKFTERHIKDFEVSNLILEHISFPISTPCLPLPLPLT
jgi:hypothetical protein